MPSGFPAHKVAHTQGLGEQTPVVSDQPGATSCPSPRRLPTWATRAPVSQPLRSDNTVVSGAVYRPQEVHWCSWGTGGSGCPLDHTTCPLCRLLRSPVTP